ncbi:MAG: hypothetical protein HYT89_07590, partial [Candidatus Omnitrophica bacterium]|nr:hypothetical protein [Candidatus Omnitrophota bacterium]
MGDKLVSSLGVKDAERVAREEVDVVMVPGMGGLSIRGGVFADLNFWSKILGWLRLGDLRLAQLAYGAKRFYRASLVIVESYFNHHKIKKMFADLRTNTGVFKEVETVRSTVTPIIESANGKTYMPYSPDGLGVASHLDLVLQPLFSGVVGNALVKAKAENRRRDNVYLATFNMNVPMSVPSAKMIGHFHKLRKQAAQETGEAKGPMPFVAFQQVPLQGEKGGFLGYITYKINGQPVKLLQIIEGFLTSSETVKKIAEQKDRYLGFNSNHAVVALGGLVDFLFRDTGITEENLTSEALKDRANFERVLGAVNVRMTGIGSVGTFLSTDFRQKMGVFIEGKPREGTNVDQVSSMLNALATLGQGAVYYLQPRGIDEKRMKHSVYGEYKEQGKTDLLTQIETKEQEVLALNKRLERFEQKEEERPEDSFEQRSDLNDRIANVLAELALLRKQYEEDPRDNVQRVADLSQEQGLLELRVSERVVRGLSKAGIIEETLHRMSSERTLADATVRVIVKKALSPQNSKSRVVFEAKPVTLNKLATALWDNLSDDVSYGEIKISKHDSVEGNVYEIA